MALPWTPDDEPEPEEELEPEEEAEVMLVEEKLELIPNLSRFQQLR